MSSKRPSKGSQRGAETPETGRPAADTAHMNFNAQVSAFAVSEETSAGDPGGRPDDAPASALNTGTGTASGAAIPGGTGAPNTGAGQTPYTTRVNVTNRVLSELQNIGTFPALGSSPYAGGGGSGSGAATPLQRTVEQALQSVLGRLPRGGDHKSFVAALNMSFSYKEDAGGRRSYEWTPRTYIGKTDLGGGVTGAQASLVTFARSAYDNSITLLDDLYSLVPETDEQEVEASIAIVRSLWTEFVGELGKEGGPRAARADSLSQTLLGEAGSPSSAANCQLTRLGMLLGVVQTTGGVANVVNNRPKISRRFVVTTEEETNLTNFVSMSDYMYSAQAAWKNYLQNFFQKDLGTGLVLLARLFSVLAETVDEVYSAMDSVYIGPAERLTIRVRFQQGKDLSVEELLSWVHSFATEEAPVLIQDGGRRGVEAVIPTATLLRQLMAQFFVNVRDEAEDRTRRDSDFNDFIDEVARPHAGGVGSQPASAASRRVTFATGTQPQALPVGMTQPRVLNPLKDVYRYLDELVRTATDIANG